MGLEGIECTIERRAVNELRWSISNTSGRDIALDAVALAWDAGRVPDDARWFSNGYQSWSPARTRRLGVDADPSRDPRPIPLVRAAFHADPGVAAPGELRSEQVGIMASGERGMFSVGFTGGAMHAGTVRARVDDDRLEIAAEAYLGGAVLRGGESRVLHDIVIDEHDDADLLLERWAARAGHTEGARVAAPYLVGWCSWYQYFHDVTERDVRANLQRAGDWPFDVFQLDDGYQPAIGDWTRTTDAFPHGVDGVAAAIIDGGYTPGIWLAPFLAAPDSEIARSHPEFIARAPHGDGNAIGMFHEVWGGVMWELDTTRPDVVAHLETVAKALVDAGYRYLKLDFTFSAAMPGRYADPTRTPAERVRAGFEAIRRGAGDDVFILGCGAPLGAVVGVVDAMRIGADVAPWWNAPPDASERQPAYEETTPATRHAFVNTCNRSFMHRRLWLNDPDCVMLRTTETNLSPDAARAWTRTAAVSGGLLLVSDDLALLGPDARALLDDAIDVGRAADVQARTGSPPRSVGLLDPDGPTGLAGPAGSAAQNLSTGEAMTTVRAIRSGPG
jgi:alpha-galactosidase